MTDPDGHTIEFVQESAIASGTATRAASALSARLLHAGVTVRNEAAASAFYHDVLGMDEIWRGGSEPSKTNWVNMRVPDGVDYLEYMLRDAPSTRRQLGVDHHICLLVPDIQRAWEQVRAEDAARQAGRPRAAENWPQSEMAAESVRPGRHSGRAHGTAQRAYNVRIRNPQSSNPQFHDSLDRDHARDRSGAVRER